MPSKRCPTVVLFKRTRRDATRRTATYWTLRWSGSDGARRTKAIGRTDEMTARQAATLRELPREVQPSLAVEATDSNAPVQTFDGSLGDACEAVHFVEDPHDFVDHGNIDTLLLQVSRDVGPDFEVALRRQLAVGVDESRLDVGLGRRGSAAPETTSEPVGLGLGHLHGGLC